MTVNDRFRELRKTFGLSQEELGNKIGLSKSGISNIESGARNVTDKHIKLICSEFPVNEEWLRNGNGDPVRETAASTMEKLREEFHLDDFTCSFVYEYLKLDEEKRNAVQEFFYNVLNGMDAVERQEPESSGHETAVDRAEAEYIKKISNSAGNTGSTALNSTGGDMEKASSE